MNESLDQLVLNFDKGSLLLLNICIGFIMFGVALELKVKHFRLLVDVPRYIFVGLLSQLIVLPLLTLALILWVEPLPSIALGMILVASCPGGNLSNFYVALSKGNVALSVSLTSISSVLSVLFTPLSFTLWASVYEPTAEIMQSFDMNVWGMISKVLLVLALPLAAGMLFNQKLPGITQRVNRPIKFLSIVIFAAFVGIALLKNFDHFIMYITEILLLVFAHNALGLIGGYGVSSIFKLPQAERRSIAIETGIQNVSVALVIIFDFFNGLGGMAFIAAWWGIWHLLAGGALSFFWSRKPLAKT